MTRLVDGEVEEGRLGWVEGRDGGRDRLGRLGPVGGRVDGQIEAVGLFLMNMQVDREED